MLYWNDGGMNGWGIGLMTVSMLLFWALVIFGVVALVRHLGRTALHSPSAPVRPVAPPQRNPAEQLLAERLARGETDPDEYRTRPDILRGGGEPPVSG
ncbi:putative membrane protein [Streptomyces sp. 1114.5]|uniref:SHOCT domain-containing protein n=1 Tax=Streptomyces sp. 1114.5 TaxID=1938830 RepID=UPI000EB30AE3|nr:SHOCT domain-containing protein [Streptomyces sp. 1114.5]RKT09374.1 putative membrane protein [Streptomyces sp. 1114.5]